MEERQLLNDFMPKVFEALSKYITDHGKHGAMCDDLNELKSVYLRGVEGQKKDECGMDDLVDRIMNYYKSPFCKKTIFVESLKSEFTIIKQK